MVALHTINIDKEKFKEAKDPFMQAIFKQSMYRKNIILEHLIKNGHATHFNRAVVSCQK